MGNTILLTTVRPWNRGDDRKIHNGRHMPESVGISFLNGQRRGAVSKYGGRQELLHILLNCSISYYEKMLLRNYSNAGNGLKHN